MARRLCSQNTEVQLVSTILETLRVSIKWVIRAADPKTFTDLMDRATQAEADEIEGQPSKTKVESTRKQISSNHVQEVRLPAYHYCPGRHFHGDCPILEQRRTNPTENERRTGPGPAENGLLRQAPRHAMKSISKQTNHSETRRHFSETEKKVIEEQIPEMLAERIIEPVSSPYCSQPSIQTKKDGTWRFCIDYRRLNDITIDAA